MLVIKRRGPYYDSFSAPVLKSRLLALTAVPAKQMSYFWLTYGSADGLIGAVIMEASTLLQARSNATVQGIVATGAPFAEGHELSDALNSGVRPGLKQGRSFHYDSADQTVSRATATPPDVINWRKNTASAYVGFSAESLKCQIGLPIAVYTQARRKFLSGIRHAHTRVGMLPTL
jgi:hypothetical protein